MGINWSTVPVPASMNWITLRIRSGPTMVDTVNIPPATTHSRMYTSRRPWIRVNMNRKADGGTVIPEPTSSFNGRSAAKPSTAALTVISMTPPSNSPLCLEPLQVGQTYSGPCLRRGAWQWQPSHRHRSTCGEQGHSSLHCRQLAIPASRGTIVPDTDPSFPRMAEGQHIARTVQPSQHQTAPRQPHLWEHSSIKELPRPAS